MEFSLERGTEVLRGTPEVLRSMLSGLSDDWTHRDEGPDTWSPYQVLGHLTYVEEADWIDRTRLILKYGTERIFDPVDREAGFTRFKDWTVSELLDRFTSQRIANLNTLEDLINIEDLDRKGIHPSFGEVTISQLIATWVVHDLNHLGQIVKTMAKQYTEAVGPWREFLPIIDAP
jgi:uncharacterized damage-inducible protein DinB